jgi:hypothetical protein
MEYEVGVCSHGASIEKPVRSKISKLRVEIQANEPTRFPETDLKQTLREKALGGR